MSTAQPDPGHWQQDDQEIRSRLKVMGASGVRTITWNAHRRACDTCQDNGGQTKRLGFPFPSGAMIPPEHNNCLCGWTDSKGRVYEWVVTEGAYKQKKGR